MKQIKERRFADKESGINSDLIEKCTDIETLLKWKLIINSNITDAQLKIDEVKGEQAATGRYTEPKNWVGLNGYRKVCGFLSQKIQDRLRELKYDAKEVNGTYKKFYDAAVSRLPDYLIMEIHEIAAKL